MSFDPFINILMSLNIGMYGFGRIIFRDAILRGIKRVAINYLLMNVLLNI
jgi:hypothetical protein